jgi:hypothetical protein
MEAIKGQYFCSFKTYELIVVFESFTGNGGGDGDVDGSEDDSADSDHEKKTIFGLKARLVGAKKAGHDVTGLSAKAINEWYTNDWYNLFSGRWFVSFSHFILC